MKAIGNLLPLTFVSCMIVACGGGNSGSSSSTPTPTPGPTVVVTITSCPAIVQRGVTGWNGVPWYSCAASVSGTTNTAVTWSSSSTSSLTIDSSTGALTPLARGSVTITATSAADPSKTATASVKVVDRLFTAIAEPLSWLPAGQEGVVLWYLETDGSDTGQLLTTRECWYPAVSPDHRHVACGTYALPTDPVQYGSTELTVVTTDGTAAGTTSTGPLTGIRSYYYAWSPDGKTIAMVGAQAQNGDTSVGVFTVNPDGTGLKQLTSEMFAGNVIRIPTAMSFSPDGKSIAYNVTADDYIRIMNADGSNSVTLPVTGSSPVYSRDGSEILFYSSGGISAMKPDGSGVHLVVPIASDGYNLAVSPDGSQLAYDVGTNVVSNIYLANLDGSGNTMIPGAGSGDSSRASSGIGW